MDQTGSRMHPPGSSQLDLLEQSPQSSILRSQLGSNTGLLGNFSFRSETGIASSDNDTTALETIDSDSEREKSVSVENVGALMCIFSTSILGVQAFMSYSGGATPAALPAIQATNPGLTQFEISLLGSLDKIGQVIASPLWGRALQRVPTKVLLVIGLIANAGFSLQFGFVSAKYSMFLSKFMQGCTESQQIVWGNLWTESRAPRHLLSTWMNLGGVAAGVGTAVGQAVAGFSITAGLPYCVAYVVQAAGLTLLWVGLLFTPHHYVALPTGSAKDGTNSSALSVGDQLRVLLDNRLYWLTMLCVAENNFITGGTQFFWTRFFCNGPWTLNLGTVTAAGLLVQGAGMGLGIFLGPALVNRYGGYYDDLGRYITLCLLQRITAIAMFGAGLATLSMAIQLSPWLEGSSVLDSSLWNPWLWTFWLATVPINFALAAQGGVQTVINIGSVPREIRPFGQGLTTSVQFLFGYAGGVILPSIILDVAFDFSRHFLDYTMSEADQLATGMFVVCTMTAVLFATVNLARAEALAIWQREDKRPTS